MHHHNWQVCVEVGRSRLDGNGMVMDFSELKAAVDDIVAGFDNTPLDKFDYFRRNQPSAENVARYIYEKLRDKLPGDVKLQSITVVEQPGCAAKFSEPR